MTDEFTPTAVHESLDRAGLLDAAHGPGCYALALDVPDSVEAANRDWLAHFDALPGNDAVGRLARAEAVAYVGASKDVYGRLEDHAKGEVRKARVMQPFPPTEVIDVWPEDSQFIAERQHAYALADDGWRVWCDGEVVG